MMAMTRADWDVFQTNRSLVLDLLKSNQGDFFSAKEIADFLNSDLSCDLNPFQVGKVLSNGFREGLVNRKYDGSQYTWCITDAGTKWMPKPYDWRHAKGRDKPAKDHPYNQIPAVSPSKPDTGAITRPLPIHLETKKTYADLRMAKILDALDDTPALPTIILEDEPMTDQSPCHGACANHAKDQDQEEERRQARDAFVAHLLAIADAYAETGENLGASPVWKTARRLAPHFGLEENYA